MTITQKAGVDGRLFGSVTNIDIVEALQGAGPRHRKGDDPDAGGSAQAVGDYPVGGGAAPRTSWRASIVTVVGETAPGLIVRR